MHTHIHAHSQREQEREIHTYIQDGIIALGKAHMHSALSLSSPPKVAFEMVPVFVWFNAYSSHPRRVECWPFSFSIPLSFRRSMLWCSGLSMFRNSTSLWALLPCQGADQMWYLLYSPVYLPVHSHWLWHAQGSRSTEVFCSQRLHGCVPVGAAHSRLHLLQQVHWVCENDGMCNLWVMLGDYPLYCMYDCFYLHDQTGDFDSVGNTVFLYSLSTLLNCKPPTRPVLCDWVIHEDHDVMWLYMLASTSICTSALAFPASYSWQCVLGSLATESHSRAWTQLGIFHSLLLVWALWGSTHAGLHILDWLFCLAHPWLASCQSTPLLFFDSIVEWQVCEITLSITL